MTERIDELYKKHYYPNVTRFYQILKENGIEKTLKEVKEFYHFKQSIKYTSRL